MRGLLVKDVAFEKDSGSKIDGVYELAKVKQGSSVATEADEDENILFLKAKVMLRPSRNSLLEFSRATDKTKIEIRSIKVDDLSNRISLMSKK